MTEPEPKKDWMEIWYETGDITWQKGLSPEAEARIKKLIEGLMPKPDSE
jgi:hypothetical protein